VFPEINFDLNGAGCSVVEASRKTYMASGACSSYYGGWWHGMWTRGRGCVGCGVEDLGGGPAAGLVQHVGRLHPIG
jgi:hypothetical protein